MEFTYIGNQDKKDVRLAGSFANGAFVTANSAASFANAAFDRANAAYAQANNSTDTWVRTQANNAYDKANSSGSFANGAFVTANSAASFANGAFTVANSAASFANAAFTTANLKFNSSGGTISGDVNITGNLSITGNTFSTSATQIVANDTLFIMGTGNYLGDVLDIGFASHYNDSTNAHTGLIRDAGTKEWQLFEGYTPEVGANNNIIISDGSFKIATLNANLKSTTITIKNIDLLPYVNNAYDKANSGASFANAAFDRVNAAYAQANTGSSDSWARGTANAAFITANLAYNTIFTASNTAALYYITRNFTGNGNTNTFTISSNTSANSILVFDNGITQNPLTDYSVSGNTITFVEAPANGSIIQVRELLSNIPVVTDNSNSAFDRANSAYATANAAFTAANNSTDTWVRGQANNAYDTANSSGSFANGAFTTANSAASFANSAFTTANSAASFANSAFVTANSGASFANGAFDRANAAFTAANNSTDTWVRTQANTAYNAANSAASFANGAFTQANSASSFANGAFVTANAAASFANGAFDRANSGYGVANTGASFANGAFVTANSAASFANGSFVTANSAASFANGAFLRANSGYGVANSGASFANGAFTQANTAASLASAAFAQANAAFDAANTSGGSSSGIAVTTDNFTANGNTTTFTLSVVPSTEDFITAIVDGTVQYRNSYTVANGVITFDSTFENGALIEVTSVLQGANVTIATSKKYFTFVQTGSISTPITGTARSYPTANCTISNVYASLGTAASDTFTFVLKKNGTTVGTYTMSSGTYRMGATAASISLTSSDYLMINITTGTGATDLKVDLEYS